MQSAEEDEDSVGSKLAVGVEDAVVHEAAPGRPFQPLLQYVEEDDTEEEKVENGRKFSANNHKTLTHQQSSIAELEAETAAKSVSLSRPESLAGLSTSFVAADEEQPSCSDETVRKGDLSPIINNSSWWTRLKENTKHIFVLSTAGKPIFSRHGNEEDLSTLSGVMQALVSFATSLTKDDELYYVKTGVWKFVFVHRPPLILVAAACTEESVSQLRHQLKFLYNQILSILTLSHLTKIFEKRNNFDLRRLLTGTERTFENLLSMTERDPSHLLNAVKCHYLPSNVRDSVGQTIVQCISKSKNVVFAILIANNQLVTMSRMKKYFLHPSDLGLIINLVAANPSFKNVESWSPICLPRFDNTGFLHAHISYLADDCNACLLLLTVDRTAFYPLSEIRTKIVDKLTKNKVLQSIKENCNIDKGVKLSDMGINDLWHFLYKYRTTSQYTCPVFERPYIDAKAHRRLFAVYLRIHNYMHSNLQQLKIFYVTGDRESILGWITSNFELYAVFSPVTTKSMAIGKVDKLMKWLKKEEDQVFILNPPLF